MEKYDKIRKLGAEISKGAFEDYGRFNFALVEAKMDAQKVIELVDECLNGRKNP